MNDLMVLAGEIAKRDPEFKDRVVSQFQEFLHELEKAFKAKSPKS